MICARTGRSGRAFSYLARMSTLSDCKFYDTQLHDNFEQSEAKFDLLMFSAACMDVAADRKLSTGSPTPAHRPGQALPKRRAHPAPRPTIDFCLWLPGLDRFFHAVEHVI
jgi:hypothetical protein